MVTLKQQSLSGGYTLVELLITLGVGILVLSSMLSISFKLQTGAELNETTSRLVQIIRSAKSDSTARYNNVQHGVFFEINPSTDDRYVIYEGTSYATRDASVDIIITLDSALLLSTTVAGSDINFSSGVGAPSATGTVTILHATTGESKTITINTLGAVDSN